VRSIFRKYSFAKLSEHLAKTASQPTCVKRCSRAYFRARRRSEEKREGQRTIVLSLASKSMTRSMLSTTPVRLRRRIFFSISPERGRGGRRREREGGRHGSAPSKIIPWSVSWHPMIVRQRLEWSVSLSECTCALHVLAVGRLSRSPAAYKTVTSGRGTEEGEGFKLSSRSFLLIIYSPSYV